MKIDKSIYKINYKLHFVVDEKSSCDDEEGFVNLYKNGL